MGWGGEVGWGIWFAWGAHMLYYVHVYLLKHQTEILENNLADATDPKTCSPRTIHDFGAVYHDSDTISRDSHCICEGLWKIYPSRLFPDPETPIWELKRTLN